MIEVSIWNPITRVIKTPNPVLAGKVRIEFVLPRRPFLVEDSYQEAEMIQYPRGYGMAYVDWNSNKLIFAPIPFNIVVGALIWAWNWVRIGFARWCYTHRHK